MQLYYKDPQCADIDRFAKDAYGDNCQWYDQYPATCGLADNDEFVSAVLCCMCGGGTTGNEDVCVDSSGDATDTDGFGCAWYDANPQDCGLYDQADGSFEAADMCCSCGGGGGDYFDPVTTEVSSLADIF